uniref:UDP-glucuronosyltransferase n=1 Tax=Panagrellus redivivus TaxID=6233 RepID=A0A7E5A0M2_PANRE
MDGKLADIAAQAGHEVSVYQPILDEKVKTSGFSSPNITLYSMPKNKGDYPAFKEDTVDNLWEGMNIKNLFNFGEIRAEFCTAIMNDSKNHALLKAQNFDLVVLEWFEPCGYGVIQKIGAKKYITTWSGDVNANILTSFGIKTHFSYSPGMMSTVTEKMTFLQRVSNMFSYGFGKLFVQPAMTGTVTKVIQKHYPDFDYDKAVAKSSFFLFNAEEHVSYVLPRTPKIINIPNMDNDKPKPLTGKISEIVESEKTKGIVLFSFGSVIQAFSMPSRVKEAFLGAFSEFPEITFFWKYEKPEDGTASNIPNVIVDKWLPQRDLLYHPKIRAFITHGGQNSLNEAAVAGVPLLSLPVFADQPTNTELIKYRGTGLGIDHKTITKEKVVASLREILNNDKYREKAKLISRMIQARPLTSKEIFLKSVDFAAEFGETGTLSAEGANQSAIVLYSLDVIGFLFGVVVVVILLLKWVLVGSYGFVLSRFDKKKVE